MRTRSNSDKLRGHRCGTCRHCRPYLFAVELTAHGWASRRVEAWRCDLDGTKYPYEQEIDPHAAACGSFEWRKS